MPVLSCGGSGLERCGLPELASESMAKSEIRDCSSADCAFDRECVAIRFESRKLTTTSNGERVCPPVLTISGQIVQAPCTSIDIIVLRHAHQ